MKKDTVKEPPTLTILTGGNQAVVVAETDRDTINFTETLAHPSWFLVHTKEDCSREWYLRFQVTGLNPRIYGPFPSQHNAILYLDSVLDEVEDVYMSLFNDEKGTRKRYYSPAQDFTPAQQEG